MEVRMIVKPAANATEARALISKVVEALLVGHSAALKQVIAGGSYREAGWRDSQLSLEAQLALASIEMYLINQEIQDSLPQDISKG
jgi:hypothetical protein